MVQSDNTICAMMLAIQAESDIMSKAQCNVMGNDDPAATDPVEGTQDS